MAVALVDWISPDAVRGVHYGIFLDDRHPYLRSGPFQDLDRRAMEQRIGNVPGHKLRRILGASRPSSNERSQGPGATSWR